MPRNPDTAAQRDIRRTFADTVKSWQALTGEEKYKFMRKARSLQMSGYNLYISEFMKERILAEKKSATGINIFTQGIIPSGNMVLFPSVSPSNIVRFTEANIIKPLQFSSG